MAANPSLDGKNTTCILTKEYSDIVGANVCEAIDAVYNDFDR